MVRARPSTRNPRSTFVAAAGVALCVTSAAAAAGDPVIGYWTEANVVVADETGAHVRTLPDFYRFSFGGGLLAGQREGKQRGSDRVIAYDLAGGERAFEIRNATNPVVPATGDRVVFLPTYRRDPYARSVWVRTPGGKVRKVAQFRSRGVPGIPHGMGGDGGPLEMALDHSGRYAAVVFGLESLRAFDVWVVDTKTREATRMTRGENSHNPSLSPDAEHLAVRVERPEGCPDPLYGEILVGKVRVVSRDTGAHRDLTEFGCDVFYDTPRWIDDETLVAVRATKDASEEYGYDLDLVRMDAASGTITELLTEGNPCCVTSSPSLGRIAFGFSDRPGFAMLDLESGEVVDFEGQVYVPHLSGEGRS